MAALGVQTCTGNLSEIVSGSVRRPTPLGAFSRAATLGVWAPLYVYQGGIGYASLYTSANTAERRREIAANVPWLRPWVGDGSEPMALSRLLLRSVLASGTTWCAEMGRSAIAGVAPCLRFCPHVRGLDSRATISVAASSRSRSMTCCIGSSNRGRLDPYQNRFETSSRRVLGHTSASGPQKAVGGK